MTVSIPLSQGKQALIDDEDYPLVSRYKWHYAGRGEAVANRPQRKGRKLSPTQIKMHRMITNAPDGMVVDHINGNKLDNRRCNLRICTQSQNLMNRRATGGYSRYKGVTWSKDREKWQANLKYQKKNHYLGHYDTEEEAARAYDSKAREMFGEYARLNFPKSGVSAVATKPTAELVKAAGQNARLLENVR